MKALKLLFLFTFVFSVLPHGGVRVAYPTLDEVLGKIAQERSPAVAQEVRRHARPSDMCGVKAVIKTNHQNIGFDASNGTMNHAPMTRIEIFAVKPQKEVFVFDFSDTVSVSIMPQAVLSPPPRLLA